MVSFHLVDAPKQLVAVLACLGQTEPSSLWKKIYCFETRTINAGLNESFWGKSLVGTPEHL